MQYLRPVGPGPSGNTWPRWASHLLHRTSVRDIISDLSVFLVMLSVLSSIRCVSKNDGQPEPESNLYLLGKRETLQQTQVYIPARCQCKER